MEFTRVNGIRFVSR